MPIDWAATGNWMQAWAGFAQAGAVIFVATKGADAFNTWRRQKIEERKLDIAETVLDVAYRMRRSLSAVRSPMMLGNEIADAEASLQERDAAWLNGLNGPVRRTTIHSEAVYNRLNSQADVFADLLAITPKAKAYFGDAVEGHLRALWQQRGAIAAAAQAYSTDRGNDQSFSDQIRRALWTGYGAHEGVRNEVDDATAAACDQLDKLMQPILRETAMSLKMD